jgi:hypothetical protein
MLPQLQRSDLVEMELRKQIRMDVLLGKPPFWQVVERLILFRRFLRRRPVFRVANQ